MPSKKTFAFGSGADLIRHALSLDYFQDIDGSVAIPVLHRPGEGPLTVIVGDNASGKSFFRRIVGAICAQAKEKTEFIPISMEGRRSVSYMPWLALVYGDESWQATGAISAGTVTTGMKTSQGREGRHVLFWDEPDLGLSDAWSAGVGVKLREFSRNPPPHLVASFIVTHSKALVSQLLDSNPHYMHVGVDPEEAPQTLTEWFERPVIPRDIEELGEVAHKRFKTIQKILEFHKP